MNYKGHCILSLENGHRVFLGETNVGFHCGSSTPHLEKSAIIIESSWTSVIVISHRPLTLDRVGGPGLGVRTVALGSVGCPMFYGS